jgi:RNA polymerase sigma factor (sigma-70 family)
MPTHARTLLGHLRRLTSPAASDAALLARWMDRHDENAFADLVARHGPMVLGVCRRVLGDAHTAEDAFQATFLVLARKAANLRRPASLPGFLYGVALRLARKARGAARWRMVQAHLDAAEPADPHPHPLDALSGRELLGLIDEEVNRLPEMYRLPLLLCVLQERPIEEAARLLGWSVGSVRGRLARGRERLRERLTRRGLCVSVSTVALLSPVAVPERLLAESVRNLAAPVSPTVSALAASVPTLKVKAVGLGLLVVAISLGAGLPFLSAPAPEEPASPNPAAPPAQVKHEPRRDRYGDPLPPGAIARLGTLRFRVRDEIKSLAFAPDGKTVAIASYGVLFLFDAATGKRLQHLSLPDGVWGRENPIAFSPDGKRLARRGGKKDGQRYKEAVFVWDLASKGKPRDYDAEHAMWIGWSTDGEPLAVCLEKDALRLRELASGRSRRFECKDLRRPELFEYVACAFAPAGKTLAVADEQTQVHIWDTATGRQHCVLPFKNAYVLALALSPDGRILASLTRDQMAPNPRSRVQLWDAVTGTALHTLATDQKYLQTVVFTPDGKTLATAGGSDVRFWDVAMGRERGRTQDKHNFDPHLAFSADGKLLVTAERHSNTFHVWDVTTGRRKAEPVGHSNRPHGTAFTPDGRRVATGGGLDGTIHIWDLESGESLTRIRRPGQWVRDIAFSLDGRSLFSTWTDDELWISGTVSGGKLHVLKLEDPDRGDTYQSAISMYQSDDGKTLVALSYYYARKNKGMGNATLITGWDTSTRKQLFRRRRPGMDSWVALSGDARVMAVPYPEGREVREMGPGKGPMRLEDLRTGEVLLTFPALEGQTWPLAFSPDGRLLASNNSDWKRKGKKGDPAGATGSALHLWETATAAEVLALPLESQYRTAFSPDGRLLALIAPSQEILIWDLAHNSELRRFTGFGAEVTYLAFSPDGRRLLSGLSDSTLLVWDVGPCEARPGKPGTDSVAKAWADLAGSDAPRAFRARWTLAVAPEETLPLLKERLRPAKPADAERLRRLLADLASEQFTVREKAQANLEELGELAEPALRQTLADKPTLEVRRRVQAVLQRLRGPVTRPEMLRSLRAVAVLEAIATPAARKLLEELASGAPEARLTREAKASLSRLDRRMPIDR